MAYRCFLQSEGVGLLLTASDAGLPMLSPYFQSEGVQAYYYARLIP